MRWCRIRSWCRCRGSGFPKWRRCGMRTRSMRCAILLIKDKAFTEVAVFGMDEPDVVLALKQPWVSIDNDSQGTSPEGLLGTRASASAGVWDVSADPAEVCARRECADAARCDSQIFGAAGAADAADRSRRAEAGDVGRCGGVRSGDRLRTRRRLRIRTSSRWEWSMCW